MCGGTGTCGTCRVRVMSGELSPITASEDFELGDAIAQGYRLACQAEALSDVRVDVPPESLTTPQRTQTEGTGVAIDLDPCVTAIDVKLPVPDFDDLRSDSARLLAAIGSAATSIDYAALIDLSDRLRANDWTVRAVIADRAIDRVVMAVTPSHTPLLGFGGRCRHDEVGRVSDRSGKRRNAGALRRDESADCLRRRRDQPHRVRQSEPQRAREFAAQVDRGAEQDRRRVVRDDRCDARRDRRSRHRRQHGHASLAGRAAGAAVGYRALRACGRRSVDAARQRFRLENKPCGADLSAAQHRGFRRRGSRGDVIGRGSVEYAANGRRDRHRHEHGNFRGTSGTIGVLLVRVRPGV